MISEPMPPRRFKEMLRIVGPGIVVAATGVGVGDLVAAARAGSNFGLTVLWCAALGAVLKFALAEGVARWQLSTGSTIIEGWVRLFGRSFHFLFLTYLVIWTVWVCAALMSACGLAAHALFPGLSVEAWGVLHAIVGLAFVWIGGYEAFERIMKIVIGAMFIAIVGTAALQTPSMAEFTKGLLIPTVPHGSAMLLLGVIGGVGGTVTLLSYNYWIREKGWSGAAWMKGMRFDLAVGYGLTGIFGVAVMLLAAAVLLPKGIKVAGKEGVLDMAVMLGERFGRFGEIVFLVGFWGAVSTSLLGVWQGIPYLFGNYMGLLKGAKGDDMVQAISPRGGLYRTYVLFMTFAPMPLLFLGKPVWIILGYAALGSLFMLFLAISLLIMNNRKKDLGPMKNGALANGALILVLVLFAYLGFHQIRGFF